MPPSVRVTEIRDRMFFFRELDGKKIPIPWRLNYAMPLFGVDYSKSVPAIYRILPTVKTYYRPYSQDFCIILHEVNAGRINMIALFTWSESGASIISDDISSIIPYNSILWRDPPEFFHRKRGQITGMKYGL